MQPIHITWMNIAMKSKTTKWHELPKCSTRASFSLSLSLSLVLLNAPSQISTNYSHTHTDGKYEGTRENDWKTLAFNTNTSKNRQPTANKLKQHIKATEELMTFINCVFCFCFFFSLICIHSHVLLLYFPDYFSLSLNVYVCVRTDVTIAVCWFSLSLSLSFYHSNSMVRSLVCWAVVLLLAVG